MINGLKRWLSGSTGAAARVWDPIAAWARQQKYDFRVVHDDGFVVDGRSGETPWRLEWGPSQRPYVLGHELRLRAELGLPPELQLVLMNRQLQVTMENAVFEQYVEGVQTLIDDQTPPEMRWLVMFPKLSGSEMGPLRENFVALASGKLWLTSWLNGSLTGALSALLHDPAVPLVLMIGRGRLLLRTAVADPEVHILQAWLKLFAIAIQEAGRVGSVVDGPPPATPASAFDSSAMPDGEAKN